MSGIFITFEGCEGVGKSTQLRELKKYLVDSGQKAVFTREPGGTPLAEEIRKILLSTNTKVTPTVEAYLFATARADHMARVILPALNKGEIVVCDRFIDSSLAYQGFSRGLGFDKVMEINKHALDGRMPDCTIFLDMPPSHSWRKQMGKEIGDDRMEQEGERFHSLVYEGFKELEKTSKRFISICPRQDKMDTHQAIIKALREGEFIK